MCFRIIFDINDFYKCCVFIVDKRFDSAYDIPVINYGTVVEIQSTRCNGIKECWDNIDELGCGFSTSLTILLGM